MPKTHTPKKREAGVTGPASLTHSITFFRNFLDTTEMDFVEDS